MIVETVVHPHLIHNKQVLIMAVLLKRLAS